MQFPNSVPHNTGDSDRSEATPAKPDVKRYSVDRLMRQKIVLSNGVAISVEVHNGRRLVRVESPIDVLPLGCATPEFPLGGLVKAELHSGRIMVRFESPSPSVTES